MKNAISENAIIHFSDLSFNSDHWGLECAIVKWDEESNDYLWLGIKKQKGYEIYFDNAYSLSYGKWFFFRGLTLVKDSKKNEEYHLLSDEGKVLIIFNHFPSEPVDLDAEKLDIFDEEKWKNITYCFDFFIRFTSRGFHEINFGYNKVFEEGQSKYFYEDLQDYWSSCQFNKLYTAWNTCGERSLFYDQIYNYHDDDGTCLVKNNGKYAIINRWFQRISPWFDDFIDKDTLSEMLDDEASIPDNLLSVSINNEVIFLELCGNFVHDKILNPFAFFRDFNNAKKLYDPFQFFITDENDKDSLKYPWQEAIEEGIIRISIEEDYMYLEGSLLYPDIIPFYLGYIEYFALEYDEEKMKKFVIEHNSLMGISPSGYRVVQRFIVPKDKTDAIETDKISKFISPYSPGTGKKPKPKGYRFFNSSLFKE
jgi:hypothetical protein